MSHNKGRFGIFEEIWPTLAKLQKNHAETYKKLENSTPPWYRTQGRNWFSQRIPPKNFSDLFF